MAVYVLDFYYEIFSTGRKVLSMTNTVIPDLTRVIVNILLYLFKI